MAQFEESIESWKRRLEAEIKDAKDYMVSTFSTSKSNPYETKHSIRFIRGRLEKCMMYLSYMETLNEKAIQDSSRLDTLAKAGKDDEN